MRAPLSVVIPVLDDAHRIGPCLGALGEALFDGLIRELIFVDGGSSDAIATVADEVGATLVEASLGRGTQLAAGAEAASGMWYLFLHADTVLGPGWSDAVRIHIASRSRQAGWFRLAFDVESAAARRVAAWANWRARRLGLPYGDQGLLISRALYREIGGFPPIPLMEDVALVRRLRGRLAPLDATAVTSAERYRQEGWTRRGARNLGTLLRYFAGARPERLAERYRR